MHIIGGTLLKIRKYNLFFFQKVLGFNILQQIIKIFSLAGICLQTYFEVLAFSPSLGIEGWTIT